ncbi:MAG: hypothetical protein FVQ80_12570 [Planctomycetes bacterium]|nr:hypothetical protein [Planctomycetota bacterium]
MKTKIISTLSILLIFTSCLFMPSKKVSDIFIKAGYEEKIKNAFLVLDKIIILKDFKEDEVRKNAEYIFQLITSKHNQQISNPTHRLYAVITIKEDSFIKEFVSLNTVSIETQLVDKDTDEIILQMVLSEESPNTITSYSYLYEIMETSLKTIF